MANNNVTKLQDIIIQMQSMWTQFKCKGEDQGHFNQFLFGWEQEVDDVHLKYLPLMVMNIPSSSASTIQIEKEIVKTSTSFVCQIYDYKPSRTNALTYWDNMEDCFYYWLELFLLAMGSKVQMGSGSLKITRTKQASNDQLYQIECRFNLDYFRYCIQLD